MIHFCTEGNSLEGADGTWMVFNTGVYDTYNSHLSYIIFNIVSEDVYMCSVKTF